MWKPVDTVKLVFPFHAVWVLGIGLVPQAYTSALPPEPPHWPNFTRFLCATNVFASDD